MRRRFLIPAAGALALTFAVSLIAQSTYTYQTDIEPVIDANCAFCHDFMADYDDLMATVTEYEPTGLPVVNPGKPDSSMIVWRLEGELPSGESIEQMPRFADPLSEDTIRMFRDWIAQGAVNDTPVGIEQKTWGEIKNEHR